MIRYKEINDMLNKLIFKIPSIDLYIWLSRSKQKVNTVMITKLNTFQSFEINKYEMFVVNKLYNLYCKKKKRCI